MSTTPPGSRELRDHTALNEMSVRVRLDLAYDGTDFSGWAAQPGLRTVEGVLAGALSTILRQEIHLTVAGRTDAGVHARHQVAHVDVPISVWEKLPGRSNRESGQALISKLSGLLGRESKGPKGSSDVVVRGACVVPDDFDARFSALSRSYSYRIADDVESRYIPRRFDTLWVSEPLNIEAMNNAMAPLVGEHDFLAYCKPREGASTIRRITDLAIDKPESGHDAGLVVFHVEADAFCHSMVRSLVGAALAVGQGKRDEFWPLTLLQARDRQSFAAPVAPPHGLSLERISYPSDDKLGEQARAARVRRTVAADDCGCGDFPE
ncbi:tRNA pseudouridine(38-40) synthase TruA [Actinomyces vulturis]|uniref:tRNA pseudouridine(38-40) synthase TruA n=1 Tax=Actinomyces vulturis TaxID=1857645 RepID=UPI0009F40162